jgi:hypothetical protein
VFDINYVGPDGVGYNALDYMYRNDVEQLGLHSPGWLKLMMIKMLNLTLQNMPSGLTMLHFIYPGNKNNKTEIYAPNGIPVADYATAGVSQFLNVSAYPNMPDPQAIFDLHQEVGRIAKPTQRVTIATSTNLNAIWPALGPEATSASGFAYISPLNVLIDPGHQLSESVPRVPIRTKRTDYDDLKPKFFFVKPRINPD